MGGGKCGQNLGGGGILGITLCQGQQQINSFVKRLIKGGNITERTGGITQQQQFLPCLGCFLQTGANQRVRRCQINAYRQHHIGSLHISHGGGGSRQHINTGIGGINAIRADDILRQIIGQEQLLGGQMVAHGHTDNISTHGLAERIDGRSSRFESAGRGHIHHALAEVYTGVGVAGGCHGAGISKAACFAQAVTIGGNDLGYIITLMVDFKLAGVAAEIADTGSGLGIQRNGFLPRLLFLQGAGGANRHALAAALAAAEIQRQTEIGIDNGGETAVKQAESIYAGNFLADADAVATEDTLGRLADDERVRVILGVGVDLTGKFLRLDIILPGKMQQTALIDITAATFQTTAGLKHGLIGGKAFGNLGEVGFAVFRVQIADGNAGFTAHSGKFLGRGLTVFAIIRLGNGLQITF